MIYPLGLRVAQSLPASATHSSVVVARQAFNTTIPCTFDGLEFFASSPALNLTCDNILQSATAAVTSAADARSVTSILWSCIATVFACTWVSVHPNIPHPDATEWQIRRHRFLMMLCGLVAPELIVLWALRQWVGARFLVRKIKENKVAGFTLLHAHFMQMGGFMMYVNGTRIGLIHDHNHLVSCITDWKFVLPTAGEITDRSKGDGLSKALVVGQTGWFVAQCISRRVAGLALTQIELVTLAFAVLNSIVYFLWWNKPVDVRYAVHVMLPLDAVQYVTTASTETLRIPSQLLFGPSTVTTTLTPISSTRYNDTAQSGTPQNLDVDDHLHLSFNNHTVTLKGAEPLSAYPRRKTHIDDLKLMRRQIVNSRIGRHLPIFKSYLQAHWDKNGAESEDGRLTMSLLHLNCDPQNTAGATALASVVGILFGAVHCLAWDFHFLSAQEKTLWRYWTITITTIPVLLLSKSIVTYLILIRLPKGNPSPRLADAKKGFFSDTLFWTIRLISRPSVWTTFVLAPIYVIARVGLIFQALVALRRLEPTESAQVQWAKFLPHL